MEGLIKWLALPRKQLLISMDWVDVRQWHCLVLAARYKGRAIPLLWAAYEYEQLFRSQNNYEYGLLLLLRSMIPASTQVVILADRGFGRAEMARRLQKMGFSYIIRIQPDVWLRHPDYTGKLIDMPIRNSGSYMLRDVMYRKKCPVKQHIAILWPKGSDQPWFLMTNLPRIQPQKLSKIFSRRMTIEEYFRDCKSKRNGFALRLSMIRSDARRLERLLLIAAMAYWLLIAIGLYSLSNYSAAHWNSSSRNQCSLFTIGRHMLWMIMPDLPDLMKNMRKSLLTQNWG